MSYQDLRDFITTLNKQNELKTITTSISPYLEITEVCDRVLRNQGPALLFQNPTGFNIPLLANLFGTTKRIAMAMNVPDISHLRAIGKFLAILKEPEPPTGFKDALHKLNLYKNILHMHPKTTNKPVCQQNIITENDVDLTKLPIQTCWPEDVAPLLTWGLVITKGTTQKRQNLGIYRQQLLAKNKLIMRWLSHRGGALDYQSWRAKYPNKPFPICVALGCDPATTLAAVTPIPDSLSEYAFAGLLRNNRSEVAKALNSELQIPARAEIILEGVIYPDECALEGPFGDHTGYYNEQDKFPVFTVQTITYRDNPIYHSTYTGRPPDEPAMLGIALNEVFIPLLQKQFPEITDFYLPAEGCSYRLAIVAINKQYAGHARRIMLGIWSFLRQFMYTKFVIVVDDDIDIRNWHDVIWAITTRMDPKRDMLMLENTPIDYLDFASPVSGLGSKMGLDATNKLTGETNREWGRTITKNADICRKIDAIWHELDLS